jgi:hypothetical protein
VRVVGAGNSEQDFGAAMNCTNIAEDEFNDWSDLERVDVLNPPGYRAIAGTTRRRGQNG